MGLASSLFFSDDSEKVTLHRNITPSDEQFDDQMERWRLLAEYLKSYLSEKTGYPIESWLQGSYKFDTQIRPMKMDDEFDIDLGIYYCWPGEVEDTDWSPQSLKDLVQEATLTYAEGAEGVIEVCDPPKPKCARIRFEGSFHIDVPAYHLDKETDTRSLITDKGWEDSDPKAIYLWFKDSFDDTSRAKVRRQIKYLKAWAALKFPDGAGRPSSILLTVLAADAFHKIDHSLSGDDEILEALLSEIIARLGESKFVKNPINSAENLAAKLTEYEMGEFIRKLFAFHADAAQANTAVNTLDAAVLWEEVFGHFFPLPENDELSKQNSGLPVPIFKPYVKVHAVSRQDSEKEWSGENKIGPIPKNCDIHFSVANPQNMPPGATIHWMVRNKGKEAEYINDLGHPAKVGLEAKERSAYIGKHYMDCIVKQFGQVIGINRVEVEINGTPIVRRNPTSRPDYVQFNRKRK